MSDWLSVSAAAAALILVAVGGVVGHFLLHRRRAGDDVEGLKLDTLVAPLATFAVILVSFTLITTFAGYREAWNSTNAEAGTIDQAYEIAGLLPAEPLGVAVRGHVVCYARAVVQQEWPLLDEGGRSPVVQDWTRRFEDDLRRAQQAQVSPVVLSKLIDTDNARSAARGIRLTRSSPAAPIPVFALLTAAVAAAVFALTLLASRTIPRVIHYTVTGALALLMVGALTVVTDLNRPYKGVMKIPPTAISSALSDDEHDFTHDHPGIAPPCDDRGNPR